MVQPSTLAFQPAEQLTTEHNGEKAFFLSDYEWNLIQLYVREGVGIPGTEAGLRKYLFNNTSERTKEEDFNNLLTAFKDIRDNCKEFYDKTFPESVQLAGDIYDYGINKVATFYPGISQVISALEEDPENDALRTRLKKLIEELISDASEREKKSKDVLEKLKTFEQQTRVSQNVLDGEEGHDGLAQELKEKYGMQSTIVKDLQRRIKGLREEVSDLKGKVEDFQTAQAVTAPALLLLGPCGAAYFLIAEASAGVSIAVHTLNLKNKKVALEKSISELNTKEALAVNLFNCIEFAQTRVKNISAKIKDALPYIEKMCAIWNKIVSDLKSILTKIDLIETDVDFLKQFALDDAAAAWEELAQLAQNYRVHAFVKIEPVNEEEIA